MQRSENSSEEYSEIERDDPNLSIESKGEAMDQNNLAQDYQLVSLSLPPSLEELYQEFFNQNQSRNKYADKLIPLISVESQINPYDLEQMSCLRQQNQLQKQSQNIDYRKKEIDQHNFVFALNDDCTLIQLSCALFKTISFFKQITYDDLFAFIKHSVKAKTFQKIRRRIYDVINIQKSVDVLQVKDKTIFLKEQNNSEIKIRLIKKIRTGIQENFQQLQEKKQNINEENSPTKYENLNMIVISKDIIKNIEMAQGKTMVYFHKGIFIKSYVLEMMKSTYRKQEREKQNNDSQNKDDKIDQE